LKPTSAAIKGAKKFSAAKDVLSGKTVTGNLFSSNRIASTSGTPKFGGVLSTPGQRKGKTIHALDGLGKALERLSLPRPSRPSSAFGDHPVDVNDANQISQTTASGTSLTRSNGVFNLKALTNSKQPAAGIGKLGLPMRRPGLSKAPASELEPVTGSPIRPEVPLSGKEPLEVNDEQKASKQIVETTGAEPFIPESSFVIKNADLTATSVGHAEPKFSVDDLVLKMNGIVPRTVSSHSQAAAAPPTEAEQPSTSTIVESSGASQPRLSNAIRVTEVSRALNMTIAQRDEVHRLTQRNVSERPVRPIRSASIVQRKQHQLAQEEQLKQRSNTRMAGSLDVLKGCVVYVDIATENNEDAGGTFVDMLRGLGARVSLQVGLR
jgi:hypothetical protein